MRTDRATSALFRYAPVLILVILQGLILVVAPAGRSRDDASQGAAAVGAGQLPGAADGVGGALPTDAADAGGRSGGAPGGGPATNGTGATVPGARQQVDALGRPLTGDRSKCAKGGQLQQDIVRQPTPCTPKLEGPNGGATYRGVTPEKITVVRYRGLNGDALDALLETQGLAVTKEKDAEILELFERFLNKRYELYGRQLDLVQYDGQCDVVASDRACFRADAKALVQKHQPYMVIAIQLYWQIGDELARLGVPSMGTTWGRDRAWLRDRPGMFYEDVPDGDTVAETMADYWCKRLADKPASRAGEPALRVTKRRLGILVPEDPSVQGTGKRLQALLSGSACGSAATKPFLYVHSDNESRAQEQFPNIAAQMKEDGVTSVTIPNSNFFYLVSATRAFDQQAYFPEHILSGTGATDHDAVGRLASPSQWQNAFGVSFLPQLTSIAQTDGARAVKDVAPEYRYENTVTGGTFIHVNLAAILIQSAGPVLNPRTMQQGAFSLPQRGGFDNPQPFPGWKCCDPTAVLGRFGTYAGDYTSTKDAKEVRWDQSATSTADGKQGAYICARGCARTRVGAWPAGEAFS